MILRHFPENCPPPGWPNLVIHARAREVDYSEHSGPLSLKCVFQGEEIHQAAGVRYAVDEHSVLLLNHARPYSSHIHSRDEVEVFSLFFERTFAARTLRCLTETVSSLLDDPTHEGRQPLEFFETLYPRSQSLAALLREMRDRPVEERDEPIWLEEHLHQVLAHLIRDHLDKVRESDALTAVRPATRTEQYRRLLRARDFIEGNLSTGIDLSAIATVSCLSSFHLLRLFKRAFGESPHQYLIRRRLERARDLLATTDLPIWEVCQRVGYESLSSFSRLVLTRYGSSPRELRRRLAAN